MKIPEIKVPEVKIPEIRLPTIELEPKRKTAKRRRKTRKTTQPQVIIQQIPIPVYNYPVYRGPRRTSTRRTTRRQIPLELKPSPAVQSVARAFAESLKVLGEVLNAMLVGLSDLVFLFLVSHDMEKYEFDTKLRITERLISREEKELRRYYGITR